MTRPWDVRRALIDGCVQCWKRATSDRHACTDPRVMRVQWQAQKHFGNMFVLGHELFGLIRSDFVRRGRGGLATRDLLGP